MHLDKYIGKIAALDNSKNCGGVCNISRSVVSNILPTTAQSIPPIIMSTCWYNQFKLG